MYDVTMPKLSDSMKEGKIIAWKVKTGDKVAEGDILAEIESDKATMELEGFRNGTVAEILHDAGAEVAVGDVIARIDDALTEIAAPIGKKPSHQKTKTAESVVKATPPPAPRTPSPTTGSERVRISPYAKKLAEEKRVDYSLIKGSGHDGRIMASDIEAIIADQETDSRKTDEAKAVEESPLPDEELPPIQIGDNEADVEDASFRLKTQARRVTASKHAIPHFYMTQAVDVTDLMHRKEQLKEQFSATITNAIMFACLRALKEHPHVNRSYDRGRIIRWKNVNLGLAIDTEEGLTVGVIPAAQEFTLNELAKRSRELVEKARSGKLSAQERNHPTFTISNLGMFDIEQFEAIINPPSSVTLAVASARPAPIVRGDKIQLGHIMKLTASCDHRIIDGVTAAQFLKDLKTLLERPDGFLA